MPQLSTIATHVWPKFPLTRGLPPRYPMNHSGRLSELEKAIEDSRPLADGAPIKDARLVSVTPAGSSVSPDLYLVIWEVTT